MSDESRNGNGDLNQFERDFINAIPGGPPIIPLLRTYQSNVLDIFFPNG
jgi:hypothetical protein